MVNQREFPQELMSQSPSEKLAYFTSCTVVHRRLKETYESFLDSINNPGGACLIFVFGPTGVGKTTLLKQIVKVLKREHLAQESSPKGYFPVATVEARSPENGNFDWKDYYKNVLIALGEPFVDYKLTTGSKRIKGTGSQQEIVKTRANLSTLRDDVEYNLKQRQLIAFLVDEAQRFTKMTSGRRQQDQMDALQSMASLTNTVHGLFGTYELLELRNLSGQLSRRSLDLHFARYHHDDEQDRKDFKRVLKSFALKMPLSRTPDLELHWEYFYERSIGCVGIVKDWLTQAYCKALDEEASTLTLNHLTPYAPSIPKCLQIATEAIEGENSLRESSGERAILRQKLGLVPTEKKASPTGSKKARPGVRLPSRDPINNSELGT